jgi:hypothetical protein
MRLDAVLAGPDLNWLTTRREKAQFVLATVGAEPAGGAAASFGTLASTARSVAAHGFPIGVDPSGRLVLLYVATAPWTADFRRFLQERVSLLQRLPAWTLRGIEVSSCVPTRISKAQATP